MYLENKLAFFAWKVFFNIFQISSLTGTHLSKRLVLLQVNWAQARPIMCLRSGILQPQTVEALKVRQDVGPFLLTRSFK